MVAVATVMTNHIFQGLNLPNIVLVTWYMSSPGLEKGRYMSFWVKIVLFLISLCGLLGIISVGKQSKWHQYINIFS